MTNGKRPIKEFLYFISYAATGLTGCILAFFLSLQFLNPVFSEDDSEKQAPSTESQAPEKKALKAVDAFRKDIQKATEVFKGLFDTFRGKKKSAPFTETSPESQSENPDAVPAPPPHLDGIEVPKEAIPEPQGNITPEGEPLEEVPSESEPRPEGITPEPDAVEPPIEGTEPVFVAPPPKGQSPQEEIPISDSLLQLKSYMEPFLYDPSSKRRNPFEDLTKKKEPTGKTGIIVTTPPERYPLTDIKLKGIIWSVPSPRALFQLPNEQEFYTLLQGERIGKYGVIKEIREDEVEIFETIVKGDGVNQLTETKKVIKRMDRLNL